VAEATEKDCHPFIVDDDLDFVFLLKRGLERAGIPGGHIGHAADGDEAIRQLSERPLPPSFVLLDLHMPGRSGLEVLEWVRSTEPLARVPVFMLTSDDDPRTVSHAFRLGVESYFLKPARLRVLEDLLNGILSAWRAPSRPRLLRGSLNPLVKDERHLQEPGSPSRDRL